MSEFYQQNSFAMDHSSEQIVEILPPFGIDKLVKVGLLVFIILMPVVIVFTVPGKIMMTAIGWEDRWVSSSNWNPSVQNH